MGDMVLADMVLIESTFWYERNVTMKRRHTAQKITSGRAELKGSREIIFAEGMELLLQEV